MRGSDGKLCFSEKERGKVWTYYMERIMSEENDWDRNVEEIHAKAEICQKVLDGFRMFAEWALSTVVPTIKEKGDNCNCCVHLEKAARRLSC